ncbi:MAG: transcriptional regulator [Acidobacteria bacterium]|nr:transcriptional regulator [Acidobacteriota bacterium]
MSTAVIDERRYARLLVKTLPRVIRTEKENERMIADLEELDLRWDHLSREEKELAELMTALIERFESEHYPINLASPQERLGQLMEDRGLTQADLWRLFGTRARASEVLKGKRGISKAQAKRLADFFRVPVDLFI